MSLDFRVDVGFFAHVKTMRLEAALGAAAPYHLLRLWGWARVHKPKGDLSGMTDREIGTASGWRKPEAFAAALVEIGFLDGPAGSRALHAWCEHNGYAAHEEERRSRARAAADARWSKVDAVRNANGNATGILDAHTERGTGIASGNAPSPSPTPFPNPSPSPTPFPGARARAPAEPRASRTQEPPRKPEPIGPEQRKALAVRAAAALCGGTERAELLLAHHGLERIEAALKASREAGAKATSGAQSKAARSVAFVGALR